MLFISVPAIPSSPTSINADRYLLKVLRRARNRFNQHKQSSSYNDMINMTKTFSIDNQSDSGVFTTSSRTNFNDDFESNSLYDIDEDYFESINIDDPNSEILCQSLEVALMETLRELRQRRPNNHHINMMNKDKDQSIVTRL